LLQPILALFAAAIGFAGESHKACATTSASDRTIGFLLNLIGSQTGSRPASQSLAMNSTALTGIAARPM
jgi:hypothetical protein